MAKVKMPLMSASASGQVAKSLVYFSWKGLDVVRSYVIPANPNTSSQQTQRGYFSNAVELFHDTEFQDVDRSALNLAASVEKNAMSGFNWFIKKVVEALKLGNTFNPLYNADISSITKNSATVKIDCEANKTAKLYWGTTKTFLPNEVSGTYGTGTWEFSLTDLPSNSLIYFKVKNTADDESGITGIYYFKTLVS